MSIRDGINGLKALQRGLKRQQVEIIRQIRTAILSLPDNPNITKLSKNCFVMSYSALSSRDWTPEYYSFRKQYHAICREIRRKKFNNIVPFLENIIKNGKMTKIEMHYVWGRHRVRTKVNIHPEVVAHLESVLGVAPEA